ncbi:hypothetical protein ACI65C_001407 [Semiaphis heraclei]
MLSTTNKNNINATSQNNKHANSKHNVNTNTNETNQKASSTNSTSMTNWTTQKKRNHSNSSYSNSEPPTSSQDHSHTHKNKNKLFITKNRYEVLSQTEQPPETSMDAVPSPEIEPEDVSNLEATSSSAPAILNAHQGEISCLAINPLGTLIASASSKGTLIRIWDTCHKVKVAELRRGSDTATLYCINFSPNSEFLCCSSDKGTIHIFAVIESDLNRRSSLSPFSFFSSYCQSQWALATFTVPPEVGCICTFLTQDTVAAICLDGTYHKFGFSKDGTSRRRSFQIYLHNCEDEEI